MQRNLRSLFTLSRSLAKHSKISFKPSAPASLSFTPSFPFSSSPQPILPEIKLKSLEDFEPEVTQTKTPVVLDFFAEWCNPCKRLGTVLSQKLGESEGKWKLVKVDIDDYPEIAEKFNVNVVPSVFLVFNGNVVDSFVGNQDEAAYEAFFTKAKNLG